jgi:hypothetical protein
VNGRKTACVDISELAFAGTRAKVWTKRSGLADGCVYQRQADGGAEAVVRMSDSWRLRYRSAIWLPTLQDNLRGYPSGPRLSLYLQVKL